MASRDPDPGLTASTLDPHLVQAYAETHYQVPALGLTLRIGEASPALRAAHALRGAACSAFITACNPFSAPLAPEDNAARQQALAEELRAGGYTFVEGIGQHPGNGWPGEPSFLVFALDLDAAREWGRRFGQNAVVWNGVDGVPGLVLLR